MKHDLPENAVDVFEQCSLLGIHSVPADFSEKVALFTDLLDSCRNRLNLVGPEEMSRIWRRHILESVAFAGFLNGSSVIDIGTGAGFPGFILALLGLDVVLVEPRRRRCAFLEVVARECGIKCSIIEKRIENAGPFLPGTEFTAKSVKDPFTLISLIAKTECSSFRLLTRASDSKLSGKKGFLLTKLPVPPLDRPGFLVQYSHS